MDDDSLRRGRPTNHVVHGEGHGDSRRRRAADRSVRAARDRAARAAARRTQDSRHRRSSPPRPARAAWSGARRSICSPSASAPVRQAIAAGHARAQNRRPHSRCGRGRRRSWAAARTRRFDAVDEYGRASRPGVSNRRRHSRRRRRRAESSARPPAKTPRPASRPIPPSTASKRRAGWRPSGTTMRLARCDRLASSSRARRYRGLGREERTN